MMTYRTAIGWVVGVALILFSSQSFAQEDPGKAVLGRVSVTVYYATNGDPVVAGKKTAPVSAATEKRLRGAERLRFKNYRMLGQDVQPLLRSYESWAQPLKPSDEILVRFEARSLPTEQATGLDLELWLSREKVLKMDARLEGDRSLFVLGPEWRGGHLIVGVALAPPKKPGS
jgi:hypothetical protein